MQPVAILYYPGKADQMSAGSNSGVGAEWYSTLSFLGWLYFRTSSRAMGLGLVSSGKGFSFVSWREAQCVPGDFQSTSLVCSAHNRKLVAVFGYRKRIDLWMRSLLSTIMGPDSKSIYIHDRELELQLKPLPGTKLNCNL